MTGAGHLPSALGVPSVSCFLKAQSSASREGLIVRPASTASSRACFSFLIHICLMDGMTGNYLPLMKKQEGNRVLKSLKKKKNPS